jgi:Tat protein secretion system quality control protein TatD with DNase activity
MIESDAPYMHIDDKRIKKWKLLNDKTQNEPIVLPLILQQIEQCYNGKYTLQEIACQTTLNAQHFFGVK